MAPNTSPKIPQTFKDSPKASHFTPDYVVVCESDLVVSSLGQNYGIFQTPGAPLAGFGNSYSPWWIQGFETHGGIPTLDPFRAKTRRFWIATRGDEQGPDADTIIEPKKIDTNEIYQNNQSGPKGGLPAQMVTGIGKKLKSEWFADHVEWSIVHGGQFYDGTTKKTSVNSSPQNSPEEAAYFYNFDIIENIDISIPDSGNADAAALTGIFCAALGSFMDPNISIKDYDPDANNISLQIPDGATHLGSTWVLNDFDSSKSRHISLGPAGMPSYQTPLKDLQYASSYMFGALFNPGRPKNPFSSAGWSSPITATHPLAGKTAWAPGAQKSGTNEYGGLQGFYRDSTFALPTLASSQAIESVPALNTGFNTVTPSAHYADIDPVYNYLSHKYEQATATVHHTKLPNIYDFMKKLEDNSVTSEIYGDVLDIAAAMHLFGADRNENKYWSTYVKDIVSPTTPNNKHSHIYLSNKGQYAAPFIDDYKDNFPMYNEISFRSHSEDQLIMGALHSTTGQPASRKLLMSIIEHLFWTDGAPTERHDYSGYKIIPHDPVESSLVEYHPFNSAGSPYIAGTEKNNIISETKQNGLEGIKYNYESDGRMRVFNFDKWLNNFGYPNSPGDLATVSAIQDQMTSDDLIKVGATDIYGEALNKFGTLGPKTIKMIILNDNSSFYVPATPQYNNPLVVLFEDLFSALQLKPEISNIVESKLRSHTEVFDGKKAYSEVLFYRIEKIHNGTTIQNFWIENTPSTDVMKYVDTQVKYGEEYEYRIHAYTAVIGTKYRYSNCAGMPRVYDTISWGNNILENGTDWDFMGPLQGAPNQKTPDTLFMQQMNSYKAAQKPIGFDDMGDILYPLATPDNMKHYKQKRWQAYVSKFPEFAAVDNHYNSVFGAWSSAAADISEDVMAYKDQQALALEDVQLAHGSISDNIQTISDRAKFFLDNWHQDVLDGALSVATPSKDAFTAALFNLTNDVWVKTHSLEDLNDMFDEIMAFGMAGNQQPSPLEVQGKLDEIKTHIDAIGSIALVINNLGWNINEDVNEKQNEDKALATHAMTMMEIAHGNLTQIWYAIGPFQGGVPVPPPNPNIEPKPQVLKKIEKLKLLVDIEAEADVLRVYKKTGNPMIDGAVMTRIQAIAEPYIKIMEVPMFSETVAVVDDPPLAPHVTFNGFVGINNKIMFSFDNTVGEEEAVPVVLAGDDLSANDKIRRKQDRDYTYNDTEYKVENKSPEHIKKKITFKADDFAAGYQVYRKSSKPLSPDDFTAEDMIGTLDTKTSSSFVDNISPNSKTYYMFRTVDYHGHVSNPTSTYAVEIVDDDGAIYVLVDVVDYQKNKVKGEKTKSFKRYLQIDPSFLQKLINENQLGFGDNKTALGMSPQLGVLPDSIYDNKKFKVRVTSRSTGKKIDINLEFKKEMDEKSLLEQPDIF